MSSITDRIVLLLFSAVAGLAGIESTSLVIALFSAVALSALMEYIDSRRFHIIAFTAWNVAAVFYPPMLIFTPMLSYDLFTTENWCWILSALVPLAVNIDFFQIVEYSAMAALLAASFILHYCTQKHITLKNSYTKQRDELKEMSLRLEEKLSELRARQDEEVSIATLNERNRIAREIHDNVGHLLSSSILQLGAIMVITKDETEKQALSTLKDTLSEGMNSIRKSVHDLRDDSVDLYARLSETVRNFTFCKANLNYEIETQMPVPMRFAVIAIVKEALANVIKHSNATEVNINLYEHPQLYQVIITDNGSKKDKNNSMDMGMGLESIRQRVSDLGGIANFSSDNGFRIFISFGKV